MKVAIDDKSSFPSCTAHRWFGLIYRPGKPIRGGGFGRRFRLSSSDRIWIGRARSCGRRNSHYRHAVVTVVYNPSREIGAKTGATFFIRVLFFSDHHFPLSINHLVCLSLISSYYVGAKNPISEFHSRL